MRYRPVLKSLESRLPPGDALLGLLLTSTLVETKTIRDDSALTQSSIPMVDPGALVGSRDHCKCTRNVRKSVTTKESTPLAFTPMQTTDLEFLANAAAAAQRTSRWGAAPAATASASQTALLTSPGGAGLGAAHPAFMRAAVAPLTATVTNPTPATSIDKAHESKVREDYGKLPLTFEANQGQTDSRVDFITRTGGATVFLTPTAAVFSILQPASGNASQHDEALGHDGPELEEPAGGVALHMEIVGADPNARPAGMSRLPGIVNYFIGNDPSQWHVNIPTFAGVQYDDVYPGIDLAYYGNNGHLEYDFIVSPGIDPNAITLNFAGADNVKINEQGGLVLHTLAGDIVQQKPFTYQTVGGARKGVPSAYVVDGTEVRIKVGSYDAKQPLVIDPLVLGYSTYLGGGVGDDGGGGIAVDAAGNAYVTGATNSTTFPTTPGSFDTSFDGFNGELLDAFVAKLSADGTSLVYGTYFGGARRESGVDIAVDSAGNAYVIGTLTRSRIPTTPGAFDTSYNGGFEDAFVAKLSAPGTSLIYATYLGGSGSDRGGGIAVDAAGNAYVTGSTLSTNFPTTPGAFDTSFNGINDAFMAKLSADGSSLVYGTFLGGSEADVGTGITVDAAGNAYLTGRTYSPDFPATPGAFDVTYNSIGDTDAFVAKLSADGASLAYSTYLGGDDNDSGSGIAVDAGGNAYVTGDTGATNFPTTPGAFDTSPNGDKDVFVAKLNEDGTSLSYGTYLGGSHIDFGGRIAVDAAGSAYVTGQTDSTDFPTTAGAFDTSYNGLLDAVLTKLSPDGASPEYSTYLGGASGTDAGGGIAVDAAGSAYVIGVTLASDFPTTSGALKRRNLRGGHDAFVTKFVET
jgi:hypothetical protein